MKKKMCIALAIMTATMGLFGCGAANEGTTQTSSAENASAETNNETAQPAEESKDEAAVSPSDVQQQAARGEAEEEVYDVASEPDMAYTEEVNDGSYYDGAAVAGSMAASDGLGMSRGLTKSPGFTPEELPAETDFNTEEYSYNEENPWMSVKTSPFSTFAADVDTASYANLRRMLLSGSEVPKDAVRIEEMMNYFSYDFNKPTGNEPFGVTTQISPCPWNDETSLLMVGMKAKDIDMRERVDSNLVFLVDVSGSMSDYDKLPLVQRSFRLLCEELTERDRVSIVTYASGDEVVLEGASGDQKAKINAAMDELDAGGSTNGSAGIQTAYEIAERNFIKGGNNRIILATDGDLNVGMTDEGSLTRLVKEKAKSGVFLSVLGFGTGNISDTNMEALADNGNGNYSYIDSVQEARRVLIDEMGGTLYTVAKDVKLQVEFNPDYVKGYRLIGYENRTMAAESFSDDTKDGGEIGAGHSVVALYEIAAPGSGQDIPEVESRYQDSSERKNDFYSDNGEFLVVNVRYKEPDRDESTLLTYPVDKSSVSRQMSDEMSWAAGVAQVGMILKDSEYAGTSDLKEVTKRLESIKGANEDDYRKEFLYLCTRIDK